MPVPYMYIYMCIHSVNVLQYWRVTKIISPSLAKLTFAVFHAKAKHRAIIIEGQMTYYSVIHLLVSCSYNILFRLFTVFLFSRNSKKH